MQRTYDRPLGSPRAPYICSTVTLGACSRNTAAGVGCNVRSKGHGRDEMVMVIRDLGVMLGAEGARSDL